MSETLDTKIRIRDRNPWLMWLGWAGVMTALIGLILASGGSDRFATLGMSTRQMAGLSLLGAGVGMLGLWVLGAAICWQITWHAVATRDSVKQSD